MRNILLTGWHSSFILKKSCRAEDNHQGPCKTMSLFAKRMLVLFTMSGALFGLFLLNEDDNAAFGQDKSFREEPPRSPQDPGSEIPEKYYDRALELIRTGNESAAEVDF